MRIEEGGLEDPRVLDMVRAHARRAREETGRGSAHALDPSVLLGPDVTFWSVWDGDEVLGVGALKRIGEDHAEVKSMYTAEAARGRGVGTALLRHMTAWARAHGITRLSLETGAWPYFAPARALYARNGFVPCPPFGDYRADPNSVFMTRALD